jgi:hypothetical protein
LLRKAGLPEGDTDPGVVPLAAAKSIADFIAAARNHRIWARERKVHPVP